MSARPKVLVIAGPTGSGKSSFALQLAPHIPCEIVGCDSVQLFQGFDIGSAKPSIEERAIVPHHLIDILPPKAEFDAAKFGSMAVDVCSDIVSRGKIPIVVGGSGLYLRTLIGEGWHADLPSDDRVRFVLQSRETSDLYSELKQRDHERASEVHANDRFRIVRALELLILLGRPLRELPKSRPPLDAAVIMLIPSRQELHARISMRTQGMLASGLIEEVNDLLVSGVSRQAKPMQSIGYKQVADFLAGEIAREDLAEAINAATRQYAKRQCTWFRKVQSDLSLREPDLLPAMDLARQILPLSGTI